MIALTIEMIIWILNPLEVFFILVRKEIVSASRRVESQKEKNVTKTRMMEIMSPTPYKLPNDLIEIEEHEWVSRETKKRCILKIVWIIYNGRDRKNSNQIHGRKIHTCWVIKNVKFTRAESCRKNYMHAYLVCAVVNWWVIAVVKVT